MEEAEHGCARWPAAAEVEEDGGGPRLRRTVGVRGEDGAGGRRGGSPIGGGRRGEGEQRGRAARRELLARPGAAGEAR